MRVAITTVALWVALALAAGAPARADQTTTPEATAAPPASSAPIAQPWPTLPQNVNTYDFEAGGSQSWLNAGRGMWHGSYANFLYAATSGFKAYGGALDTVRFGQNDPGYYAGVYVPTKNPHGTFNAEYGFSPTHYNIPASYWLANYDLRLADGFGVQAGYENKTYTFENVPIWNAGFDKYFGDDRLAYRATFASISGTPGVGFSQTVTWNKTLPYDYVTVAANVGRDIENTGFNHVAFYTTAVVVLDDVHWLDQHTAIHADVNYNTLAGAYQRYEVLLGLHVRL
ncbi:MAG TPA: YaiO family outer membrane beta-barrel protein [Candidatus Baltobacteraceae bacterium]|nr:YaiO family outer membrane beta-barrel protein [Candidatus Baltobacteraceae bacterium]